MTTARYFIAVALSACSAVLGCAESTRQSPPSSSATPAALAPSGEGSGRPARSIYDPATVETVRGRVLRVERSVSGRRAPEGVHVILRLDDGSTLPVHLGPARFVEIQGFTVEADDELEVTGSRVTMDGASVIIAREVSKADQHLLLRDEAGVPQWSRRRGRGMRPLDTDE